MKEQEDKKEIIDPFHMSNAVDMEEVGSIHMDDDIIMTEEDEKEAVKKKWFVGSVDRFFPSEKE